MSEKIFSFRVNFRPKESWVDEIFLGNLLAEVLGNVAKSTNAFEFDVKNLGEASEESSGATSDPDQ
ncbi:MAG: hypothetical protein QXE12_00510 [Conexivisphaerales archaeon]